MPQSNVPATCLDLASCLFVQCPWCCLPRAQYCQPRTWCCLPRTRCCLPRTWCCLPRAQCCLPRTRCCLPRTWCCLPRTWCCLPRTRCCLPRTRCCLQAKDEDSAIKKREILNPGMKPENPTGSPHNLDGSTFCDRELKLV
uniref:Uncharacterized protein n=1 Tax=Cyanistes caeruleus TaxID=156563 RepID=A0A8C0V6C5_CYACU